MFWKIFQERLVENQMCKPCVNWKFEATETWGLRFDMNEGNLVSLSHCTIEFALTYSYVNCSWKIKTIQTNRNECCYVGTNQWVYSL